MPYIDSKEFLDSMFGLSERRAVVTGASSGLGREMALVLAKAGAKVLLVARRTERLAQVVDENPELSDRLIPFSADLSLEKSALEIARASESELGGCDIVVANAALFEYGGIEQFNRDLFTRTLQLNVTSQAELAASLFTQLKESDAGRVVYTTSIYGLGGEAVGSLIGPLTAYTASKHGLIGLTRSHAIEWAKHNITVNAIAPGHFPTQMSERTFSDPERVEFLRQFYPLQRLGRVEEISTALLFLVSPKTSFVTGAIVPVDGGWSCW